VQPLNPSLEVRVLPGKGRCVFATRDIAKGTLLMADHIVLVPGGESDHTDVTTVGRYLFQWNEDDDLCVVLGIGSLLNHGLPENVSIVSNYKDLKMEFYAYTDIKAGEELVYDYGHEPDDLTSYYGIPMESALAGR
jgi:hypothetical protein